LRWNRSGNSQGTIFIPEASAFLDHDYIILDTTTKTTIDTTYHNATGATFFRVRAKKNDITSEASNVVVV
ncbi:MAG: hypothetical protein HW421_2329, partial [Ignavibacteria bacterium]|nr:hypothetical protein [Ignavibacteria bacterium]